MQTKTQRPVQFEITEQARDAVAARITAAYLKPKQFLFPSRVSESSHLSTRQCSRIVGRTKATLKVRDMLLSEIQFELAVMGWPIDVTEAACQKWKRDMRTLSACSNGAVKIFGMECIFGCHWTVEQIHQWILDTIELFGSDRYMFGSRRPIAKLACSFQKLYGAYFDVVSEFTASEKRKLFHDTAITIYGLMKPGRSRESNLI